MIAPQTDELAHVTSLQIFLGTGYHDHVDWTDSIISRTPALRNLDLEFEEFEVWDQKDCCDGAVRIVRKMFRTRVKTGPAIRLKTLRITSMCLMRAGHLLLDFLDLTDLENLQLVRCEDIDSFLRKLSTLQLNLSPVCIESPSVDLDDSGSAVEGFLRSLPSVKRITLRFSSESFPDGSL
jgi:hypothetical protein